MSRNDAIWAAIRIFGSYFFVKAVFAVPTAIGGFYILYVLSTFDLEGLPAEFQSSLLGVAGRVAPAVSGIAALVFYSAAGIYFIRGAPALARRIQE